MRKIQISSPSVGEEEWQALREPIETGWLTQGPKVASFEQEFAKKHQVRHAIAVTSCTAGLHLALKALNIGPGDEVIVPAFTWIATANVVLYCGAKPVFVDVDPDTYNINPASISEKINENTKAVIIVHLFGLCADVDAVRKIVPDHIKIIEDAACAVGSIYKNRYAGGLADIGVFSFHPRKIITTGEGGMVTTNDAQLAETVNLMRNHGASISEEQRHAGPKPYLLPEFNLLGYNYRMTDLQAVIGLSQLDRLDSLLAGRAELANFYQNELQGIPWLKLPQVSAGARHSWQAYVIYVHNDRAPYPRNRIMEILQEKGISTRPGTHAVHMLGLYRRLLATKPADFPIARDCDQQTLAIPLHNQMSTEDSEYIVDSLKKL